MNIGFVGIVIGEPDIKMKTCILKNASNKRLLDLIKNNIKTLDLQLDYLIKNDLHLFRISSDFIPFASHEVNKIKWWETFKNNLSFLGKKALKNNIRLSMHPGQYTIINSENNLLTKKSISDILYHTRVLDSLNLPSSHKVILHIGGAYKDKVQAISRFIESYKLLPNNVKNRLIIENDDKNYTEQDVLDISRKLDIPVVVDYLHYLLNHDKNNLDFKKVFEECRKTWKKKDGIQKIHYSEQAEGKKIGSHSLSIDPLKFDNFSKILPNEIDVMFEVKDKNLSVINYKSYKNSFCQN